MAGRDERNGPSEDRPELTDRADLPDEVEEPPVSAAAVELARRLAGGRTYIQTLPGTERRIATMAADGQPVWAIAQAIGISEAAVARTLDGVLAAVEGREVAHVETGGLGADPDPGVTGGYGDTGFGSLDTEPPVFNEEPNPDETWPVDETDDKRDGE